jgi:Tol biopolymer transport system component
MAMKRAHILALALCAVLILVTTHNRGTNAGPRDTTTWGAADPTWSPDGTRLGFTLFGSIWQVPAAGGEAVQVSQGAGYHAHPSWSPKGDWIAFISGNSPAGTLPNISGRLVLVNVNTGEEREIRLPHPTAGTPSWSPSGSEVAVPLLVPDTGAVLHVVSASGGAVRALQQRPQRGLMGNWQFASWGPRNDEIFYTGQRFAAVQNGSQRLGAPQVWSVPARPGPIQIQLPLTSYRLADIAQLHAVSPLPDGSGSVYAAVIVNGKGDRELYRIPREGGKPVPLTNTPRDEFSPAVSPDGRLIAHVSNHLGNVDLFTMPVSGGEKKHVRISGLKFRSPAGRLRIKTLDELNQPTPVRLYLRAADGKAYAPKGSQIFYYGLDPGRPREGFFVTSGDDEIVLPSGRVQIFAMKGVEYRLEERSVELAAGDTAEVNITMQRWTNWNQKGWYTGENHFHANYNGSYYQRPPDSLDWLQAEDLNTANMIVANSEGAFVHDKEFFKGQVDPLAKPRFLLYWGQEYRNSDPLGHMAFLNIKKQVPPSFTSVVGSNSSYDYPLNTMAAIEARQQGGLVVYVHPLTAPLDDPMDSNLGAKEAPLTAALSAMDAIDVLPFGPAAYELWYRLLNSGFRIVPGAGTDVFTNWRGINRIPGGSRQYVETGSEFTWDRWVERYRAGRTFVTNGPLLAFDVNGQGMGSVIQASSAPYRAKISAEVTSRVPVDRLELVRNGEVIESWGIPAGSNSYRAEKEVMVDRSAWFAVRVSGTAVRGYVNEIPRAHSGAVHVHVDGKPVLVKQDIALHIRWLNRLWAYLEERDNFGPGDNRVKARAMFDRGLAHYRDKLAQAAD